MAVPTRTLVEETEILSRSCLARLRYSNREHLSYELRSLTVPTRTSARHTAARPKLRK